MLKKYRGNGILNWTYIFTLNYKDPRLPTLYPLIGNVHNSDGSVYRKSVVFSQKNKNPLFRGVR